MSPSIQQLVERQIKNKNEPFPPELRAFALELQFYSSKSYEFVRSTFNNLLPHEATLRKWYSTIDGRPGFTEEAFCALKMKTNGSKPAVCALVVDEMAIKDFIEHDRKRVYGYQDLGTGLNTECDTLPHAQHALVFLVVSLREKWKIPVAYFLIHSLNGQERANLIRICLEKLWRNNVHIVSLTFDGAAVNFAMCTQLGAKFDVQKEINPQFKHPITNDPIYIYPDPCHMIKLVRNTLAEKGPLFNSDGMEISWQYIVQLQKLEEKECLRVATRLTRKHIAFDKNKMNVRLAVQVLSESVQKALLWAHHDMAYPIFEEADATAEFCGMLNNIFDLLNIRSRFCKKPSQVLICRENITIIEEHIRKFSNYLQQLLITKLTDKETVSFEKIIDSSRKTGFLGLLICLRNIIPIFELINRIHEQRYLLTYKILQDSIENVFCAIRQRGGFNNNPTARFFEVSYKRLLIHFETRHGGNCSVDDMQILRAGKSGISTVDPVCDLTGETEDGDTEDDPLEMFSFESLSKFVIDVNHHMAGFVVHKLIKKMNLCRTCQSFIEGIDSKSLLSNRKSFGHYRNPSSDVCKVTETAEKLFRSYSHVFHQQGLIDRLITKTFLLTAQDVFNCEAMSNHIVQQELFEDHKTNLIKVIAKVYLEGRFLHHTRKLNAKSSYIRQKSNHAVNIFYHQ